MNRPVRKTGNLRKARISVPGAWYFLTIVTQGRKDCFAPVKVRHEVESKLPETDVTEIFTDGFLILMPDHLHAVVRLGERLSLGRAVDRLKFRLRSAVSELVGYQDNFFEHLIREHEDIERFVLYALANPYRAGLIENNALWTGIISWGSAVFRSVEIAASEKGIPAEWLAEKNPMEK